MKKRTFIRFALLIALVFAAMLRPAAAGYYCFVDFQPVQIEYYRNSEVVGSCYRQSLMCGDLACFGDLTGDPLETYGNCWTCWETYDSVEEPSEPSDS